MAQPEQVSPLLSAYLAFSKVSDPVWTWVHKRRLTKGKEIAGRLREKYGVYPEARPSGRVLWFHALSVGESLALVPLIEKTIAEMPDAHVVLTTSTATSVAALDKAGLPKRAHHVLLPIDTARAVARFLDHWKPNVAVFAELDFWPRLMVDTHRRGVPMVLINARLPAQNFERRRKLGGMMRDVLGLFDALLVQDAASKERFASLGAPIERISAVGALKSAARPLPCDAGELAVLQASVGARPVWLAAATIAQEHALMVAAHARVCEGLPDALMIVAPRHVADGEALEAKARAQFEHVARRSSGEGMGVKTQVYIADTIGEMGLWYRLSPVSFVGHSLDSDGDGLEGKNPFEAAALGSAILHGPAVSYFAESYEALAREEAAREVVGAASLADAVLALQDDDSRARMLEGAMRVIDAQSAVLTETWEAIAARIS
ncbi:MAG: 3-deoxy-D-manno-octulosonic acid transferase [Silicimonas sp.]|nr:3-deoxy-D-manno-octulosonic acid transferase [Silicimonas sp.]